MRAVVHLSADGYLYGVDREDSNSRSARFWHPAGDDEQMPCSREIWIIPDELYPVFETHGTSDQEFSDGYEATAKLFEWCQKESFLGDC